MADQAGAGWSDFKKANIGRLLQQQGLVEVGGWEPGAEQWCSGSGSFPEAIPPQDSHGDCTECGEDLLWVVSGVAADPDGTPIGPETT